MLQQRWKYSLAAGMTDSQAQFCQSLTLPQRGIWHCTLYIWLTTPPDSASMGKFDTCRWFNLNLRTMSRSGKITAHIQLFVASPASVCLGSSFKTAKQAVNRERRWMGGWEEAFMPLGLLQYLFSINHNIIWLASISWTSGLTDTMSCRFTLCTLLNPTPFWELAMPPAHCGSWIYRWL